MWIRRIILGMAIVSGGGFGFMLSSCMPPVDGQASDFPPLTIGKTYQLKFSASLAAESAVPARGVLKGMGPYPWIALEFPNQTRHVNLDSVAYIALAPE
jgi:hypothetical protein